MTTTLSNQKSLISSHSMQHIFAMYFSMVNFFLGKHNGWCGSSILLYWLCQLSGCSRNQTSWRNQLKNTMQWHNLFFYIPPIKLRPKKIYVLLDVSSTWTKNLIYKIAIYSKCCAYNSKIASNYYWMNLLYSSAATKSKESRIMSLQNFITSILSIFFLIWKVCKS